MVSLLLTVVELQSLAFLLIQSFPVLSLYQAVSSTTLEQARLIHSYISLFFHRELDLESDLALGLTVDVSFQKA